MMCSRFYPLPSAQTYLQSRAPAVSFKGGAFANEREHSKKQPVAWGPVRQ